MGAMETTRATDAQSHRVTAENADGSRERMRQSKPKRARHAKRKGRVCLGVFFMGSNGLV